MRIVNNNVSQSACRDITKTVSCGLFRFVPLSLLFSLLPPPPYPHLNRLQQQQTAAAYAVAQQQQQPGEQDKIM